jgi:hypothetical protein
MTDTFTLQRTPEGQEYYQVAPGAPAGGSPSAQGPVGPSPTPAEPDPWANFPDVPSAKKRKAPGPSSAPVQAGPQRDPWENFPDTAEPPKRPDRPVSTGEAVGRGVLHGMTFGLAPALEGLSEASGIESGPVGPGGALAPLRPLVGGAKRAYNWATGTEDPETEAAYERGRTRGLEDERLAQEQHPVAYYAGEAGGAAVTPMPALRAANWTRRAIQGATQGAAQAGAMGAGEAISEGEGAGGAIKRAARNAPIGALTGGVINTTIGPRAVNPALPGARAAQTAQDLGAPIPKGLASDNPTVNATSAAVRSMPWFGAKMGAALDKTQAAAGDDVARISSAMRGHVVADRAGANAVVKPGLDAVIADNKKAIDAGYDAVRSAIDQTTRYTMPRTDAVLTQIMRARQAAGWPDPAVGLEQFRNVAGGATFNGAHRARADARDAGNVLSPNPGYNAGDYNRIVRAMTADLREMVKVAATNQTPAGRNAALKAFEDAEGQFGKLAEQNDALQRLVNSNAESGIATLLNASKEKGGNLALLAQLRGKMAPADFEVIGGQLLAELGHSTKTGEFSLAQFVTNWDKVSAGAKRTLFSQKHLSDIDDIVNLGRKIKSALRDTNTSHTSNTIILFDLARDAALLAVGIGAGHIATGTLVEGAAFGLPMVMMARWMASPAKAASMSAWSRAYQAMLTNPTPARAAVFKIATRNLANTLGVPVERVTQSILRHLSSAEPEQD